ncbi:MAG: hypothetical protein AAGM22_21460 [Acidobacteriota bacterium]
MRTSDGLERKGVRLVLGGDTQGGWTGRTSVTLDGLVHIRVDDVDGSSPYLMLMWVSLGNPQSLGTAPRTLTAPLLLSFDLLGSSG